MHPVERSEAILAMAEQMFSEAAPRTWWNAARTLIVGVRNDPLLMEIVRSVPTQNPSMHIHVPENAAPELATWGRQAWATLCSYADGHGRRNTPLESLYRREVTPLQADTWTTLVRPERNQTYVTPLIGWLRMELGQLPRLVHDLERWKQRVEWFGLSVLRGGPARRTVDEALVQNALHLWLFDQGFQVTESSPAAARATGRADFLLGADTVVPVELKLWRGGKLRSGPLSWSARAYDFPIDPRARQAYLVVVNDSRDHWLDLDEDLQGAPGPIHCGIELRVIVVDAARSWASGAKHDRTRVQLSRGDLIDSWRPVEGRALAYAELPRSRPVADPPTEEVEQTEGIQPVHHGRG